jgi:tRNA nucleotidyltransferase (CCA-adding enzyme)
MLARVSGERIRHELYLILREREPERVLCRLDGLQVLVQIHPRLACRDRTCERFSTLRQAVATGGWDVRGEENGRPTPGLYLALLTLDLPRSDLEALAARLKIYRDDLALLRQVAELREREQALDEPDLSNREIHALLHHSSSPALLVMWLSTASAWARQRLWLYEIELRHIQPMVDGDYLKGLGLRPSPLFKKLLNAVRDARLDGEIHTLAEEQALVARMLAAENYGRAAGELEPA